MSLFLAFLLVVVDPEAIVRRSIMATEANWRASPQYSYTEREEVRRLRSDGSVKSKTVRTYEVQMIDGSPYRRLVAYGGRPLSPEEAQSEQQKLEVATAARQQESEKQRAKRIAEYHQQRQEKYLLMREMAQAFRFTLVGEDQVDGREVYVFEATPRPGYRPRQDKAKVFTGMRGRLWIDKQERQWVKAEAEVFKPVSFHLFLGRVEEGTRIQLEQMPVGNGIWLPKRLSLKVDARILLVKSRHVEEIESYADYRRSEARTHADARP